MRVMVLKSKTFGMWSVWCWVGPKFREGMTREEEDEGRTEGQTKKRAWRARVEGTLQVNPEYIIFN